MPLFPNMFLRPAIRPGFENRIWFHFKMTLFSLLFVSLLSPLGFSARAELSLPIRSGSGAQDPLSGVVLELASEKDVRLLQKEPLKQLRVVHFWATWCAPCLEEFPQLLSLGSRFPEVELVAVSLDSVEDKSEVVAFLASQKSSCRNLLFKGQNAQGILKAFDRQWKELLPYTVVIDLRGKIAYRREGQLDLQEVRSVIEKLIHAENGKERRGSRNSEVVCKAWTGRGRVRDSNQRGHHILPPVSLARRFG